MQIAKLFAGLGFQVDTSGLVVFKKALADARSEMTNIARGGKVATRQFRNLRREVDKLSSSMGKIKNAGGNRAVGGSYRNLAGDVWKVNNALNSITTNQPRTTKAIGKINASVIAGLTHWNAYRRSIVQTRRSLANLNGDLARLRANSRIDVRIRNQGGGGGSGGGNGGNGGAGGLGGLGAGFGLRAMMGSFLPSLAVGSAGGALGFGATRAVEASREQTRMESTLLMTSKSGEEFARTLNYVKTEAERLGLSSTELGKSFAQINMSAKGMSQDTKEQMFTGFSEFMMSMGTSADDQKGIFRAFNQMFSNNRILQEEINQLSDRGIPATLVYDAAMKAYDTQSMAKIKKLQEDGKLDPKRVLPIMAKMVQDLAHDSGAYAKMMESSIVKQGKFYEQLRQGSKELMDSGLDVWLGKIFGQLTEIVKDLGKIARSVEFIVKSVNKLKEALDEITGGNGGLLLAFLGLLLFRFKAIRLGAQRAFIVFQNGGKITRALGELFKGILGRSLKQLILRFGGLITVVYLATKAMIGLGDALKQKDLGNWTIFDTIALHAENALLNVKVLISELRWLESFMKSGAMMDAGWDFTKDMVKSKAVSAFGGTSDILSSINSQSSYNWGSEAGKALRNFIAGDDGMNIPNSPSSLDSPYYEKNVQQATKLTFNFFDEKGAIRRTEEHELPATFPR